MARFLVCVAFLALVCSAVGTSCSWNTNITLAADSQLVLNCSVGHISGIIWHVTTNGTDNTIDMLLLDASNFASFNNDSDFDCYSGDLCYSDVPFAQGVVNFNTSASQLFIVIQNDDLFQDVVIRYDITFSQDLCLGVHCGSGRICIGGRCGCKKGNFGPRCSFTALGVTGVCAAAVLGLVLGGLGVFLFKRKRTEEELALLHK